LRGQGKMVTNGKKPTALLPKAKGAKTAQKGGQVPAGKTGAREKKECWPRTPEKGIEQQQGRRSEEGYSPFV